MSKGHEHDVVTSFLHPPNLMERKGKGPGHTQYISVTAKEY